MFSIDLELQCLPATPQLEVLVIMLIMLITRFSLSFSLGVGVQYFCLYPYPSKTVHGNPYSGRGRNNRSMLMKFLSTSSQEPPVWANSDLSNFYLF